jgi:hypothetical protein
MFLAHTLSISKPTFSIALLKRWPISLFLTFSGSCLITLLTMAYAASGLTESFSPILKEGLIPSRHLLILL